MTGKTLKELNVQVGDVVQYIPLGGISTITEICDGRYYNDGHHRDYPLVASADFTLISRAKKYTAWQFTAAPENAETHTMPDGSIAWRVEIKPIFRTVELTRQSLGQWFYCCETGSHKLTYTTIDGEIDCTSVKMVKL
jgi:hypothetical protein